MTDPTDEAVKALLDGTTEGPWTVSTGNVPIADTGDYDGYCRLMAGGRIIFEQWGDDEQSEKDAHLAGAAPALARALLDTRAELAQARADTDAAVALVVQKAVAPLTDGEAYSAALGYRHDLGLLPPRDQELECSRARWWHVALCHRIRNLAPADGLAAVEALRVEARENAMQALASMGQAQEAYEAQLKAEAERDRIAAELATSRARETALVEALVEQNELLRSAMQIAKREGVDGNVASTNWDAYYNRVAVSLKRHHDTVNQARAALAPTTTDPGDGWTWNERLGWIGPDGKPADPRRRG